MSAPAEKRGRGRPVTLTEEDRRSLDLGGVAASPREATRWRDAAARAGVPLSVWVRAALDAASTGGR